MNEAQNLGYFFKVDWFVESGAGGVVCIGHFAA